LLVDDEETVRAVGTRMLERLGLTVITANDGVEAVEAYRQHLDAISCVVLDMTMPNMDGEQAFKEIRQMDPNACVLLSSGYNRQEILERFAGKGLAGFIQKPYQLAELRETLTEAIGA
jgi:CheY-like chemotaxis protein